MRSSRGRWDSIRGFEDEAWHHFIGRPKEAKAAGLVIDCEEERHKGSSEPEWLGQKHEEGCRGCSCTTRTVSGLKWDVRERRLVNDSLPLSPASSPSPWPVDPVCLWSVTFISAESAGRWWVGCAFLPSLRSFSSHPLWLLSHFWGSGSVSWTQNYPCSKTNCTHSFSEKTAGDCLFHVINTYFMSGFCKERTLNKTQYFSLRNLWCTETYRLITKSSVKHDVD